MQIQGSTRSLPIEKLKSEILATAVVGGGGGWWVVGGDGGSSSGKQRVRQGRAWSYPQPGDSRGFCPALQLQRKESQTNLEAEIPTK